MTKNEISIKDYFIYITCSNTKCNYCNVQDTK